MKDIINSIVIILISIFAFFYAMTFRIVENGAAANPAFYPQVLAVLLGLLGLTLLINTLRKGDLSKINIDKEVLYNVLQLMGVLILYVLGIFFIGFPISTGLFIFISIILLGGSRSTALKLFIPITLVLYIMFFIVFKIPIPIGKLF